MWQRLLLQLLCEKLTSSSTHTPATLWQSHSVHICGSSRTATQKCLRVRASTGGQEPLPAFQAFAAGRRKVQIYVGRALTSCAGFIAAEAREPGFSTRRWTRPKIYLSLATSYCTAHFNGFGSHGAANHVELDYYATLEDCCSRLKHERHCKILGVEIMSTAKAVHAHPFSGPTAFMLGNEGSGLSPKQISLCDDFVYIAQYGAGTASLNVSTAAAIVLHHFALWAAYPEQGRDGQKFIVAEKELKAHATGSVPLSAQEREAEQLRRAQLPTADWLMQASHTANSEEGMLCSLLELPD